MKYKYIIFDFDGVLVESNEIRFEGFETLFKKYPKEQVQQLMRYVRANGGMSRYEKIRYFFERILNKQIDDNEFQSLAEQYSELVKQKVIDADFVKGSLEFLSNNYKKYVFVIVSGSDQEELREICRVREIDHFFIEILGSPAGKIDNIAKLLSRINCQRESVLFIGDSINDLDAARSSEINFIGRDSGLVDWNSINKVAVIDDLSQLKPHLEIKKGGQNEKSSSNSRRKFSR